MEKLIPTIAKWGGLAIFGVGAFFFARQLPNVSGDALASLGGVVVGALITVGAQGWSGTLESTSFALRQRKSALKLTKGLTRCGGS